MNLGEMLKRRGNECNPLRVCFIGMGKFGSMFAAQVRATPGIALVAVADLQVERARDYMVRAGWPVEATRANSVADAVSTGAVFMTDDTPAALADAAVNVVVESTGDPAQGLVHGLQAIAAGKHVVMANVEADALAGPLIAERARSAGVVYSLAWGDQPALICEHVDWARTCGFDVVCAGKGTRHRPHFHASTPDTVWDVVAPWVKRSDRSLTNSRMFNSFTDGSKSAIEMTAVCNATGLAAQSHGLRFPAATRDALADICKPRHAGGQIEEAGVTECVSAIGEDDATLPRHLMMGTFVVIRGANDYARRCLVDYKALTDSTGEYAALYRPTHMIGLELGVSIASVALRGEATGAPFAFRSDVAATAKRALAAGEVLDGEGGFLVWGRQVPASRSVRDGLIPLGLTRGLRLVRAVPEGSLLRWDDVVFDPEEETIRLRREMEAMFHPAPAADKETTA